VLHGTRFGRTRNVAPSGEKKRMLHRSRVSRTRRAVLDSLKRKTARFEHAHRRRFAELFIAQ